MQTLKPTVSSKKVATYVPVLDGFRGLAVLWIILGHVRWRLQAPPPTDIDPFSYVFTASYFGVDLLFVVSGFVLFLPAVVNGGLGGTKTYALRRAARIVPAFYAAMVFSYLVAWKLTGVRGGAGAWLSHALFLSSHAHPREDLGFGVNSPIWTMSVEVVFYALLPLVANWYRRHPFTGLGVAAVLAEGWHWLSTHLPTVLDWMNIHWTHTTEAQYRMSHAFPGFATQFAVGMTAAWIYVRAREQSSTNDERRLFPAVATVSALGIIAVAALRGWEVSHGGEGLYDHWTRTLDRTLLFGTLVCATALSSRVVQWPVGNDVSRFMGTVCYGAYLSHLPLIYLLVPAFGLDPGATTDTGLWILTATVVPLSFALGVVSYTFLEQPFRQLVRRTKRTARPARRALRPIALAGARS